MFWPLQQVCMTEQEAALIVTSNVLSVPQNKPNAIWVQRYAVFQTNNI